MQPGVALVDTAVLKEVVLLVEAAQSSAPLPAAQVVQFVQRRQQAVQGFPPYDLLLEQLEHAAKAGWQEKEQSIIAQALQACPGWTPGKQDKWPQKGQSNVIPAKAGIHLFDQSGFLPSQE